MDQPTCPFCGRDLEDEELVTGLCTSDDCPRHDEVSDEARAFGPNQKAPQWWRA
jgi:hypothetical protein